MTTPHDRQRDSAISRRAVLGAAASLALGAPWRGFGAEPRIPEFRLATFSADVTVPLGHGMMGGAWLSKSIADPLEARGVVLLGDAAPIVFVSVDWCEIRNDAYARWQQALAEAAHTTPERVMVTTVHQHDAPVADLRAERLLREHKRPGTICDLEFHERAVRDVAQALKKTLPRARRLTHVGTGQAKVERVASNRRYLTTAGQLRFDRTSATKLAEAIAADEGTIDPWLKTLSFWDGNRALAALSFYAVHPMSYYGAGEVSADFPGQARRRRQKDTPDTPQIYCTGCAGNVTAGKYNTGARENRPVLADRLHRAMAAAWEATRRTPLERMEFRAASARFAPRDSAGFTAEDLRKKLTTDANPFQQCLSAMGLSSRERVAAGRPVEIPLVDFGSAQLLLLPGEAYVEFQLAAQKMRGDSFVCVAGYGDGATGYIPTERHFDEKDSNLGDWCWVAPGAEAELLKAIRAVLIPPRESRPPATK